jgi:hypothetical protein
MPKDPDWDKIGEIATEAKSLRLAGTLTPEKFTELFAASKKACNGHLQFTESLLMWRPEGYVVE